MTNAPARSSKLDMYGAVSRISATEAVANKLESLILEERLVPGDSLPAERQIASQLQVSRNVLREALRAMENKGLVRIVPGHGTFVAEPSAGTLTDSLSLLLQRRSVRLADLTDARRVIEAETAARAADRRTDEQIEQLQTLLETLGGCRDDPRAHMQADLAFHRCIAQIAGQIVFEAVTEALQGSMAQGMLLGSSPEQADVQHLAIYEAIRAGDAAAARAAMIEHIDFVRAYLEAEGE
jgi:GntR family transcriptional regulator, transcriptional repressor for pyruvate dehydrogenase complex